MKKALQFLALVAMLCVPWVTQAQETLTVNDGTATNGYVPIYGFYCDGSIVSQFIIPADELSPMLNGSINKLTFYCSNASSDWGNATFEVYMTEVDYTTFSSTTLVDWGSMTLVKGESTLSISDNVMVVEFDDEFQYFGGNLMVGVKEIASGGYSQSNWYGVSASGASLGGNNTGTQQNFLPKTTFDFIPGTAAACARPGVITVGDVVDGSVSFSWAPGGDESQWAIYVNGMFQTTVTDTVYTLTGLEGLTTYNIGVQAVCGADSSLIRTATFYTPGEGATCSINVECATTYSYYNPWGNGAAVEAYQNGILVGSTSSSDAIEVYSAYPVELKYKAASSSYYNSYASAVITNIAGDTIFSGSSFSDGQVLVSVDAPCPSCMPVSGVWVSNEVTTNSAVVYIFPHEFGDNVRVMLNGEEYGETNDTVIYFDNLVDNTDYTVSVATVCEDGSLSSVRTASFKTLPSCMPVDVYVTDITAHSVTIAWADSTEAGYWAVLIVDSSYTTTDNSFTFTDLASQTTYTLGVARICDAESFSDYTYVEVKTAFDASCDGSNPITVANADSSTTTTTNIPGYSYYNYSYSEVIIPAEQLEGLGSIKALQFKPATATGGSKYANCEIYLANTSNTDLSAGFIQDTASFQLVWSGDMSYTDADWQLIAFDQAFEYDGESNIVVAVRRNTGSYQNGASFAAYNAGASLGRYVNRDNGAYELGSISDGYAVSTVPLYKLVGCEATGNICRRVKNLTATDITANSVVLSWTPGNENDNLWEVYDGANYPWVNETSYLVENLTPATTYTLYVATICVEENGDTTYGWGVDVTFTTLPSCMPVDSLHVFNITDNSAVISLEGEAGMYAIYSAEDTMDVEYVETLEYELYDLMPNTEYTYYVKSMCDDEMSAPVAVTFRTACGTSVLPYVEDFENGANCWTLYGGVTTYSGSNYAHGGSTSIRFYSGQSRYAILPQFENNGIYEVTFWSRPESNTNSSCADFQVGYMTDISDTSTFVAVETYHYNDWSSAAFVEKSVIMTDVPADARIAFHHTATSGWYWFLDDVTVTDAPSCLPVTDLAVGDVSAESATISWAFPENGYQASVQVNDDEAIDIYDSIYYLTNLTPNTNYTVSVATVCEDGSISVWRSVQFTTEVSCPAVTNLVASEVGNDFATINWNTDSVASTTYEVYLNGEYMAKVYGNNSFTFSGLEGLTTYTASVIALCGADDTSAWRSVQFTTEFGCASGSCEITIVGQDQYGDGWNDASIEVMMNGSVTSSFTLDDGNESEASISVCANTPITFNWVSGMYDDETSFEIKDGAGLTVYSGNGEQNANFFTLENACSGCVPPTGLTVTEIVSDLATVSWTPTENYDDVLVAVNGGEATVVSGDSIYVVSGLEANTTYTVSIAALCGDGDTSGWRSAEFRTECNGGNCEITIVGNDTYGDGWNGGTLSMIQNNEVINTFTIASGSDLTTTYSICAGEPLSFSWVAGSWPSENNFQIINANGDTVVNVANASVLTSGQVFLALDDCSATPSTIYDTIDQVACGSYWWNMTNSNYEESGIYTMEDNTALGIPIVSTLNLTIKPTYYGYDTVVAVGNYYDAADEIFVAQSNWYARTYQSVDGCDSTVEHNIIITPFATTDTQYVTACGQYYYGRWYTAYQSGIYEYDSVVGELYVYDTVVYYDTIDNWGDSATANYTVMQVPNFDAKLYHHIVNVTINNNAWADVYDTVYDDYYVWYGDTIRNTNYRLPHTFEGGAANGCDSTVYVHLTLVSGDVRYATACDQYVVNGWWFYESGIHYYNSTICDSVTRMEVNAYEDYVYDSTSYNGEYVTRYDTTYYTDQQCYDRTFKLDLTINHSNYEDVYETVTDNYYVWFGDTLTQSGDYAHTVTNVGGCDSTVVLHLTAYHNLTVSTNGGRTYVDGYGVLFDDTVATFQVGEEQKYIQFVTFDPVSATNYGTDGEHSRLYELYVDGQPVDLSETSETEAYRLEVFNGMGSNGFMLYNLYVNMNGDHSVEGVYGPFYDDSVCLSFGKLRVDSVNSYGATAMWTRGSGSYTYTVSYGLAANIVYDDSNYTYYFDGDYVSETITTADTTIVYQLTGLQPSTNYAVLVEMTCESGEVWQSAYGFNTLGEPHTITVINHGRGYVDDQMYGGYGYFTADTNVINGYAGNYISLRIISMPGADAAYYGFGSDSTMLARLIIDGDEYAVDGSDGRISIANFGNSIHYVIEGQQEIYFDADHIIELWYEPWVTPCTAPQNLVINDVTSESFSAQWNYYDTDSNAMFIVELTSDMETVYDTVWNTSWYDFTSLVPQTTYIVRVSRICPEGDVMTAEAEATTYGENMHTISISSNGGFMFVGGNQYSQAVNLASNGYEGNSVEISLFTFYAGGEYLGIDPSMAQLKHLYVDGVDILSSDSYSTDDFIFYAGEHYNANDLDYDAYGLVVMYNANHSVYAEYGSFEAAEHTITVDIEGEGYMFNYNNGEFITEGTTLTIPAGSQLSLELATLDPVVGDYNNYPDGCRLNALFIDGEWIDLEGDYFANDYSVEVLDELWNIGWVVYNVTFNGNSNHTLQAYYGPYYDSTLCTKMTRMQLSEQYDTSAVVSWVAGNGTDTYHLYYGLADGFNYDSLTFDGEYTEQVISGNQEQFVYKMNGLQPNSHYIVLLKMFCDYGGWWYTYLSLYTSGDPHSITFSNNGGQVNIEDLVHRDTTIVLSSYEGWSTATYFYSMSAEKATAYTGTSEDRCHLYQLIIDSTSVDLAADSVVTDSYIITRNEYEEGWIEYFFRIYYNADHNVQFVFGPEPGVHTVHVTACDSYEWNDNVYTASGTYVSGEDTLVLTVNHSMNTEHFQMACDEYWWHDMLYTTSGVYTFVGEGDNKCVNTETLYLTVNHSTTGDTVVTTACDEYELADMWFNETGVYDLVINNNAGCDSSFVLNLTVNYSSRSEMQVETCDSYQWRDSLYTESGVYADTLVAANGCDSITELYLTVNYGSYDTTVAAVCDSYQWSDSVYTATGIYRRVVANEAGCYDISVLDLTIGYSSVDTVVMTVCNGLEWDGGMLNASDVYSSTYANAEGCDSTIVLDLTVNYGNLDTIEFFACDSYLWHDSVYTESGEYTYSVSDGEGCENVTFLMLVIGRSHMDTISQTVCNSMDWHNNVYTQSGTYTYAYENEEGCANTEVLDLTVNYSTADTTEVAACDSYEWYAEPYTESGVYTRNSTNEFGCNHAEVLVLTLGNSTSDTAAVTVCDSYEWNGVTYTRSGAYTFTSANDAGCDNVSVLYLTVNNSDIDTLHNVACDSYTWMGTVYTTSGVYSFDTTNAAGCDSTVVLDLVINGSTTATETVEACNSYRWHGVDYTASTDNATYTTEGANGCDSTVTLHLTIDNCSTTQIAACDSYVWHGSEYTESGVYTDGTDTLVLTINRSNTASEFIVACDSYTWHGVTYTASTNEPEYVTTNAAGCDSTVSLSLIVNNGGTSTAEYTVCDSYTWHGEVYTISGTYSYTTMGANGCDSTAYLNLTVNYSTTGVENIYACDSYVWNGITFTTGGSFAYNSENAAGCDSSTTINLRIGRSTNGDTLATVCNSFDWYEYAGIDSTQSLSHTFAAGNQYGCDSTVTLHLTVNHCSTLDTTVCGSYTWHGNTYTTSGIYGDGTDTLILTVAYATTGDIFEVACNSYDWYEHTGLTETQSVSHTFTNVAGCDSVVALHLTVNQCGTDYVTACNSYNWKGFNFASSGTYVDGTDTLVLTITRSTVGDTIATAFGSFDWYEYTGIDTSMVLNHTFEGANQYGCDSTVTLHLTIKHRVIEERIACDSYEWNGETFTSSGTFVMGDDTLYLTIGRNSYGDTLARVNGSFDWYEYTGLSYTQEVSHVFDSASMYGCDSIVTLHLLVVPTGTPELKTTGCDTVIACDSYTWHGFTLTSSGLYPLGSDTLLLTINRSNTADTIAEACNTFDWYEYFDITETCNKTHVFSGANANGCDSVVTLHLYVNACSTVDTTVCGIYQWHGYNLTSSGTYVSDHDTLNLTVKRASSSDTVAVACGSFDWYEYEDLSDDMQSVTHTFGHANADGCDSTVTLHLAINQCSTTEVTACDSYIWKGFTLTSSGTYIRNTDTLMLTINRAVTADTVAVVCGGMDWYEHADLAETQSVAHTFIGGSTMGCDSTVTLHLTVNHCSTSDTAVCDSYLWHGFNLTSSGTYMVGHDTLMLTVNRRSTSIEMVTACNSYVWHGVDYSTPTDSATYTTVDVNGCDSVVTLHLTLNQCSTTEITACDSYTWKGGVYNTTGIYTNGSDTLDLTIKRSSVSFMNATACDSYSWHGTTYTASTTATFTGENAAGCDSITTLVLTVNKPTPVVTVQTACDSYTWNGNNYIVSGNYTFGHTDANGCNQVDTLRLTVGQSKTATEQVNACDEYQYDGQTYTESTTLIAHETTALGCDSTVTVVLSIGHSVSTYDTLVVNESELPVQYGDNLISDAGDYQFNYSTQSGCDSTVYLHVEKGGVGIDDVDLELVNLYPNPTSGPVRISADNVMRVEVMDITGRKVAVFDNTNSFNIGHLAEGSYTLRITMPQGTVIRKVIKR